MTGPAGVENALREVAPGRYDTYETLLRALGDGRVWMLLWQGEPGSPDAQYGNMEVDGARYVPCVTSPAELAASGWNRSHEVLSGREIAAELYREHYGLWLNPHAPGGGVGVPWADLRRVATGLDRAPAGPLQICDPAAVLPQIPQTYAVLAQHARQTPPVRSLRAAWVGPALGEPYLAIGLDLYDTGPRAVEAVRVMMQRSVAAVPAGLPMATVAMSDGYDPVTMWLRACARPFYDRDAYAPPPAPGPWGSPAPGPGYPGPGPGPGWRQQPGWSRRV